MKKSVFLGLFAFFFLMQIPFIFSLDSDVCHDVSRSYRSDCRGVLHMDLSDNEKLLIIDYLEDSVINQIVKRSSIWIFLMRINYIL